MTQRLDDRSLLEALPVTIVEIDAASNRVLAVTGDFLAHLGLPEEQWTAPTFWQDRILPEDLGAVLQLRARSAAEGTAHRTEYRMEARDGRIIWTAERLRAVPGPDGRSVLVGALTDITDRKQQELAVWRSEERLRAVLRNAPDAMVLTSVEGRILEMNAQAEALFGYRLPDVLGSSFDHLVPARVRTRLPELRAAFDRDPDRRSLVDVHGFAIERSDGTEVPAELGMSRVSGEAGEPQLLCSLRDLTARRRIEAQLRTTEQRLREMANVVPAMVAVVGPDQRFRFCNDAYAEWYGWERRQLEGRLLREVVGESLYGSLEPHLRAALHGAPRHMRGELADSQGRVLPVDVSMVPQYDDGPAVSGCLLAIFDVSQDVATQDAYQRHREELAHVTRVATLGELAASIAHELNQPLSAIVANARAARNLLVQAPNHDEALSAIDDIASDGRRAGQVIASMRDLLRRGETARRPVDVQGLVTETVELLRSEAIARGVTIIPPDPAVAIAWVRGDPTQLKQAVLNLLMNALEAASSSSSGMGRVRVEIDTEGDVLHIRVSDNGPGLPEDPEELFAPFVSHRAEGLGMGLAITRSIADAHGGSVRGETLDEGGAAFTLSLPTDHAEPAP